jgi:multidrug efflux pump subunit AcrB
MYTTAAIRGGAAKGFSSGQAIAAVQQVAKETLPHGFDIDWVAFLTMKLDVVTKLSISSLSYWHSCM